MWTKLIFTIDHRSHPSIVDHINRRRRSYPSIIDHIHRSSIISIDVVDHIHRSSIILAITLIDRRPLQLIIDHGAIHEIIPVLKALSCVLHVAHSSMNDSEKLEKAMELLSSLSRSREIQSQEHQQPSASSSGELAHHSQESRFLIVLISQIF